MIHTNVRKLLPTDYFGLRQEKKNRFLESSSNGDKHKSRNTPASTSLTKVNELFKPLVLVICVNM